MHRFFLPADCLSSSAVTFPADTARQISQVLRLRAGQHVLALDNRGQEYEIVLEAVGNPTSGQVLQRRPAGGEPRSAVTLYLCLTQREKFEWMLQKCTEVGAAAFVPVISSRSLVQDAADVQRKLERWQRIVQEAAEQCGRGRVPLLSPALRFAAALQAAQAQPVRLIPWEEEQAQGLRAALTGLDRPLPPTAVLIGPEGGFSNEEVLAAQAAGFQAVTLGARILRMETAAVVAAALVLHEAGEMG